MKEITLLIATKNKNKVKEIEGILAEFASKPENASVPALKLITLADVGFTGEIEENGNTFEENAAIKAKAAAALGYISVADDSGICAHALGGEPGIYSARYAGGHGDDEANNQLLLKNLADKADRSGAFVSCIACVFPEERDKAYYFEGRTEGEITHEYRGEGGFGYDPLFYYAPMNKTYAEMTAEEKNSISHRGKAMKLLVDFLVQHTGEN